MPHAVTLNVLAVSFLIFSAPRSRADVPNACSTMYFTSFEPFQREDSCDVYRRWAGVELDSICQSYRVSDLNPEQFQRLKKIANRFGQSVEQTTVVNSVYGSFKTVARKKLALCVAQKSVIKIDDSVRNKVPVLQEMLLKAILKGDLPKVQELIALKASANVSVRVKGLDLWPLIEAAKAGQYEILRYLRDEGGAKPLKKIEGTRTSIDLMNDDIAFCEKYPEKCPAGKKERLQKSIRILINYE